MAVAYASDERSATVVHEVNEVNPDGFKTSVDTSNNIHVESEGHLKDEHTQIVTGKFQYVSPEGKQVEVTYTADENGYKPIIKQN